MKFSYNWLKEYLPHVPSPQKAAELLHQHAFEVTDVVRKQGDWVFDIDILPNRMVDASSHLGIAREIAAIMRGQRTLRRGSGQAPYNNKLYTGQAGGQVREPKVRIQAMGRRAVDTVKITIEAKRACSRYSARIIEGVKVKPSPAWLKKRLAAVGVGSVNNIVDAANYVMLEYGQPLHAFDLDKIADLRGLNADRRGQNPKQIVVRFARDGEKIVTLDGDRVTLTTDVLLIADPQKPLAIAGIKGGAEAGISPDTKNILIESATFDGQNIFRASRLLGIRSDASVRFSAGRAVEQTAPALERATSLIQEFAGGRALWGVAEAGSTRTAKRVISLDLAYATRLVGMLFSKRHARRILEALGCSIALQSQEKLRVTPPADRPDLALEEDLIEELGRMAGFNRIPRHAPRVVAAPSYKPDLEQRQDMALDILASLGFFEAERYAFTSAHAIDTFELDAAQHLEVKNPPSALFQYMRTSIAPGLLSGFAKAQTPKRICEFGPAWTKEKEGIAEWRSVGLLVKEPEHKASVLHGRAPSFFELKGVVQELLSFLGLADVSWTPGENLPRFLHRGRSATLLIDGKAMGYCGELSPKLQKKYGGGIAVAELNFSKINELASEEHEYRMPSAYPEAVRDIAVLVPQDTLSDEVGQVIAEAGGELVRDVDLFDYYEGDDLPDGQKSLAFRVFYQAMDRTLTDKEIGGMHQKIETALRRREWEVR